MQRATNLLPPQEQRRHRAIQQSNQIANFGIWLIFSLVILVVIAFVAFVFLRGQLKELNQNVTARQSQLVNLQQQYLQSEIQTLNRDLKNFQTIKAQHSSWGPILQELGRQIPSDVTLESMELTRAGGQVQIAGRAGQRDSVLQLRQNLLASDYFERVNFPLKNLEKATDLEWSYRFFINSERLK